MAGYYLCLLARSDSGPLEGNQCPTYLVGKVQDRGRKQGGLVETGRGSTVHPVGAPGGLRRTGREGSSGVRPGNPRARVRQGKEERIENEWIGSGRAEGDRASELLRSLCNAAAGKQRTKG
jgi:hypothetical protein